jgi:WD domain, G-beta repeat
VKRREFIAGLGSAAAWPVVARAQQLTLPVVAFFDAGAEDVSAARVAAFRGGLNVAGYVEGQNVTVKYYWLEGQFDGLPMLMADLARRRVAVIATPGSTAADRIARLWDRDGKWLATLQGHTSSINSAVFSPDGGRILTASVDGTARLWRRDGMWLATLQGHTSAVTSAVFAPDGSLILTTSHDNTARLWEAFPDTPTLMDLVKAEVPRCLTPEQRERLLLAPEPPRWCIDMHKWPYDAPRP